LADVPVGWTARLAGWDRTPPARRQQLRAFGLRENGWLTVVQQTPATILLVDGTELAIERALAALILVESAQPDVLPSKPPST
jgi:Fe2+ transport system protein FeoA